MLVVYVGLVGLELVEINCSVEEAESLSPVFTFLEMVGRSNRSAYRIIYYLNIYIFVINIVTNPIFCKPEHTYIYYVIHHLYQTTFISF